MEYFLEPDVYCPRNVMLVVSEITANIKAKFTTGNNWTISTFIDEFILSQGYDVSLSFSLWSYAPSICQTRTT